MEAILDLSEVAQYRWWKLNYSGTKNQRPSLFGLLVMKQKLPKDLTNFWLEELKSS